MQFGNYVYDNSNNAKLYEQNPIWPKNYNRARITSAVITGVYVISDDLSVGGHPELKARAREFLQNPEVNAIAEIGRTFKPLEGDSGTAASNT
ncbi:MAG TPA: hypothetical protein VM677_21705 [Actinokineospora sp.]|nr:hypothetical protein [Actinokineospora sp.]